MAASLPPVEQLLGLLRLRVVKRMNLAVRDFFASDSYVVLKMAEQKLKTRVVSNNVNPERNEELTFLIAEPIMPIKLEIFDKDTFIPDDLMGDAELDILPLIEARKMDMEGTTGAGTLSSALPSQENCLAEESRILWLEGKWSKMFVSDCEMSNAGRLSYSFNGSAFQVAKPLNKASSKGSTFYEGKHSEQKHQAVYCIW